MELTYTKNQLRWVAYKNVPGVSSIFVAFVVPTSFLFFVQIKFRLWYVIV